MQFCSYQNVPVAETNSLLFWRWDYPHENSLLWIPILVVTYNISEKKLFVDIARQVIVENVKHIAMIFNLLKKAMILDMLRKLSFPLKFSEKISDKYSVLESPCYKILDL